jgi:hypothetical protein
MRDMINDSLSSQSLYLNVVDILSTLQRTKKSLREAETSEKDEEIAKLNQSNEKLERDKKDLERDKKDCEDRYNRLAASIQESR